MNALPSTSTSPRDGTTSGKKDVLIVQEHVPQYRQRFFELLDAVLRRDSISLRVAIGKPAGGINERSNSVAQLPMVHEVPVTSMWFAGRRLTFKRLGHLAATADLVIAEQALRNVETYMLLLRHADKRRVALWGHGKRHVKSATTIERLLERRITLSADWFFAYTEGGAELVAEEGFPRQRITVVRNTIDVEGLARLRARVSRDEARAIRTELNLPDTNVCLFIGELDAPKRIPFLLDACALIARRLNPFTLVVAGDGAHRGIVEERTRSSPWLRYVGRALDRDKARLGAISDVLLMPGRVGLVAVDSFALQTPIITTRWPYHAPEVDYLEDGVNARISGDSVAEFADAVEQALRTRDELSLLKAQCAAAVERYSLDTMVSNFSLGVVDALEAVPRRDRGSSARRAGRDDL